jgi:Protein tyrosine and serine/threonine kinase
MQVLYEMLARTMLIFSELPPGSTDPAVADQYAAKVCRGYRPARPLRMAQAPWQLITECWAAEPAERPNMAAVIIRLEEMLHAERGGGGGGAAASAVVADGAAHAASGRSASMSNGEGALIATPGPSEAGCACTIS